MRTENRLAISSTFKMWLMPIMLVLENDEANFQALNVGSGKATTVLEYAQAVLSRLTRTVDLNISSEYRGAGTTATAFPVSRSSRRWAGAPGRHLRDHERFSGLD